MKAWEDDVLRGFDWISKFSEFVKKERGQLYGTIIYLMISNNLEEIELPNIDTFLKYQSDYYIQFVEEDGKFKARLIMQEDNSGKEEM
jgi:hypothetical protein